MLLILVTAVSFPVSAHNKEYSYSLKEYTMVNTDPSKYTFVEMNQITSGLRQYINDTTADNKGCKVTFYVKYNAPLSSDIFVTYPNQAVLAVNTQCIGTLYQRVDMLGNAVTFDWDSVLAKANWPSRRGIITDIEFGTNTNVTITGFSIYVPEQSIVGELSAGAECNETAIVLQ